MSNLTNITCLVCAAKSHFVFFPNARIFARHLQHGHGLSTEDYTIKYLCEGVRPVCAECGKETRYKSFAFKRYCKNHSHIAESEAGKIGGTIKETWNKGKTKANDKRIKKQAKKMLRNGNHFFGKHHLKESVEKMKKNSRLSEEEYNKRLENKKDNFETLTQYDDYNNRQRQYLLMKCKTCGKEIEKTLKALEESNHCPHCRPKSKEEEEIAQFVKSLGLTIEENVRNIISPKELDIYIPEKNFAIEYNGNYWHIEDRVGKKLHQEKVDLCLEKGISLMHVFSDEWGNKKEIVKSMIKHRIGLSENKIMARKCQIMPVSSKESKEFFEKTHISGKTNSSIAFGLYYENKLVACLSFKKPVQKKYEKCIEIARFSTENNTHVIGGFSRLFNHSLEWIKKERYKIVLTYADMRFGMGKVYAKYGFEDISPKNPNLMYWYVGTYENTDYNKRFFRFKFRALKVPKKTEKQVATEAGVYKIYGTGNKIYKLEL